MALAQGTRLGHYAVAESIGVGGMGEVYRATDTKLGRDVAIKVLPEELRRDEERLARLEREARALAALNHPNIGTLYGLESEDDVTYLVMELVPGDTLERRLRRGPLVIDDALEIFEQIADALEAAHAAGIVHRDLKPANIKITPEGRVKVLDFGLAKAFAGEDPVSDLSSSPTRLRQGYGGAGETDATAAGVIMGTASYMSPEQAKGKSVDKRADVWAFGCVIFEALAGRKAFDGESVTDVLANVIHKDPRWEALPAETPWRVRDVVRRCLTKDPKRRFHDVADARIELTDERAPAVAPPGKSRRGLLAAVGVVAALGGAAIGWLFSDRSPAPPVDVQRFVISPPRREPPMELSTPAISDDGRRVAYIGTHENERRLYLRELDELDSRVIDGTEGAHSPSFSPDGTWVGFLSGDKLRKVSVLGGAPVDLCDAWSGGPGAAWRNDETIWFSPNWISGFHEVSADGGAPRAVTTPDRERGEVGHWWPDFLPDGKTALFSIFTDDGMDTVALLDLASGTWRHLFPGMYPRYTSGYIVYFWAGIYQAVAFDVEELELRGTSVPVLENTRGLAPTGHVNRFLDASDTGTVVTIPGGAFEPRSILVWLARDGSVASLPFGSAAIARGRLDSGGTRVALSRLDGGIQNIWIYDLEQSMEERLTRDFHRFQPQWTPDGRSVVFTNARRGEYDVFFQTVDGVDPEAPVLARDGVDESAEAISPDGRWLAIMAHTVEMGTDLFVFNLEKPTDPIPIGTSPFDEREAAFSRDSDWVAFSSNTSGRFEVYVQRVDDDSARVRVSSGGGSKPIWSPVEDELYYVSGGTVMAVRYNVGGEFRAASPRALVELPENHRADRIFEISPDGERFLVLVDSGEDPPPTELHVTTNWINEMKLDER